MPVVLTIYTGRGIIFLLLFSTVERCHCCACHSRELQRTPRSVYLHPGGNCGILTIVDPPYSPYCQVGSSFFLFRLNCWWFSMMVCFPGCLPRPIKLDAYKGGVLSFDHGMGHFNPEAVFLPRLAFAASRVGDGGWCRRPLRRLCQATLYVILGLQGGVCGFL